MKAMESDQCERHLATAVNYLLEMGQHDAAAKLAKCEVTNIYEGDEGEDYVSDGELYYRSYQTMEVDLAAPLSILQELNRKDEFYKMIQETFEQVIRYNRNNMPLHLNPHLQLLDVDANWREKLLSQTQPQANNQNPYNKNPHVYLNMSFNSPPEIEVAKALERAGVMYFPNCLVRVGKLNTRETRIIDFLVCSKGKWGVLEVDGKAYHTPTSATQDHERRRMIEQHSASLYFDRRSAADCMSKPDEVVQSFLELLHNR